METTVDQVKEDLRRTIDRMRHDLTRIEILTAALSAFSNPVPDYEPTFRHLNKVALNAHELGGSGLD